MHAYIHIITYIHERAKIGGYDEYWKTVTDFCNDKLFGSLAATLIQHPSNTNESIIAKLRYGSIGVNSGGGTLIHA